MQIHPQSGATFVDHLTIPKRLAKDDHALMEYLAHSTIHQVLLPVQQLCAPSMLRSRAPEANVNGSSYRTTDQQLQRPTHILHNIKDPPTLPIPQETLFDINLHKQKEATIHIDSAPPTPHHEEQGATNQEKKDSSLDPKVYKWLAELFGEETSEFQHVLEPFEEERITYSSLEYLEGDDLKEMGISVKLRIQLLQALSEL